MEDCPKCNNRIGFSFGTCLECGWNHTSNKWTYIKVDVDYLPYDIRDTLIRKHEKTIKSVYR